MRYRPSLVSVAIALGAVAALSIASPVLGGGGGLSKATKRQIRREVARQIGKAKGPAGANGVNGATNVVMRESPTATTVPMGAVNSATVDCVGSERAVGGGGFWDEITTGLMPIVASTPLGASGAVNGDTPIGWRVHGANNTGSGDRHLRAWVVCASP